MSNIVKAEGFVVNTTTFKESSLIASILAKKCGKIKVLAKGVRRPKSKFCGVLELFNLDEIIFYKRESKDLYTLSDAAVLDNFGTIRAQPRRVNSAMVLCEFFDKTLPLEEPDDSTFDFLFNFLKSLRKSDDSHVRQLTFQYLLKALSGAGVRPHLENCVKCHKQIKYDNRHVDFSIGTGGIVCDKDFDDTVISLSSKTHTIMKKIYKDEDICIDDTSCDEIEKFIPDYLYYHLNGLILNSLRYLR